MPKSVEARTHPCFTPLLIGKGSDEDPSYCTVPFMSSWKDVIILRSLGGGGHPILCKRAKRPCRLTKSKASVRSMKAMYSGCLCSQHFSCSCLREKIISMVDRPAPKPHWASG